MRNKPDGAAHFQSLLAGFSAAGIKDHVIREMTGISTTTIWRGRVGEMRQPQFSTIKALEDCYQRVVGDLPTSERRR